MKQSPMIIDMTVPESSEDITDGAWSNHINKCSNELFGMNVGSMFRFSNRSDWYNSSTPKYFDHMLVEHVNFYGDSNVCMLLSYSLIQDVYAPGNEFRFIMSDTGRCKQIFDLHTIKNFKDWEKLDLKTHNCVLYMFICDEKIYYSYAHPKVNMTSLQNDVAVSLRVHFKDIDLIKQ